MTNLKAKLGTAAAIAAFAGSILAPAAFADTDIVISGNGADSTNKVTVDNDNSTSIKQTNTTNVTNVVETEANTGGNVVSGNTGGSSDITTGNVVTKVNITNGGSTNTANVDLCGCPTGDLTIKVKNNGADSYNKIKVEEENNTWVKQKNNTTFTNVVGTSANTGYNKIKKNTNGSSSVTTGWVKTKVTITNTGSSNVLNP